MALINFLSSKTWREADPLLETGFKSYTIIHTEQKGPGQFVFAVKKLLGDTEDVVEEENVVLEMLTLEGASGKRNPLGDVKNCQLKVEKTAILGIDVDGDCVVRIV